MTEIYLGRHGQTPLNIHTDIICGQSNDIPLTELGEQQAAALGMHLADAGLEISAAFSSTAVRAYKTASIALNAAGVYIPITQTDALLEMSQGEAEGKPRTEIYTPSTLETMRVLSSDFALPGGESVRVVGTRYVDWILDTAQAYPNQTVFAVGHGLATRCAVGKILGWKRNDILAFNTPNCSLTKFVVDGDSISVPFVGSDVIRGH